MITVKLLGVGAFQDDLNQRLQSFARQEENARKAAARKATEASRAQFRTAFPSGRPPAAPRAGRPTTRGRFASHLNWKASAKNGIVVLDVKSLDKVAPYWIIQEIGTGERATVRRVNVKGAVRNPRGRPKADASYIKTVKPQKGRPISSALVWSSGPRGQYTPPGGGSGQQLFLRRGVKGAPVFRGKKRKIEMRITKEIKGKHFVKKGGHEGFSQYNRTVLAAARTTLRKARP